MLQCISKSYKSFRFTFKFYNINGNNVLNSVLTDNLGKKISSNIEGTRNIRRCAGIQILLYISNIYKRKKWSKFEAQRETLVERIDEKRERAARTRVTHRRANKRRKTSSKSIRCSEGGGRRSAERTFRQPWMHYLPPAVFYDFLGSHNKVRQREFRTMALSNRPPPSFVGPLVPSV